MAYQFNIITTQKGREPLWTPSEVEIIMAHLDEGDLTILRNDAERARKYIADRHDQLVGFGITEMEPVAMMAGAFSYADRAFPDFREYLVHVKEKMALGEEYLLPSQWKPEKVRGII